MLNTLLPYYQVLQNASASKSKIQIPVVKQQSSQKFERSQKTIFIQTENEYTARFNLAYLNFQQTIVD